MPLTLCRAAHVARYTDRTHRCSTAAWAAPRSASAYLCECEATLRCHCLPSAPCMWSPSPPASVPPPAGRPSWPWHAALARGPQRKSNVTTVAQTGRRVQPRGVPPQRRGQARATHQQRGHSRPRAPPCAVLTSAPPPSWLAWLVPSRLLRPLLTVRTAALAAGDAATN